jgi:hypothetical protein
MGRAYTDNPRYWEEILIILKTGRSEFRKIKSVGGVSIPITQEARREVCPTNPRGQNENIRITREAGWEERIRITCKADWEERIRITRKVGWEKRIQITCEAGWEERI